MISEDGITLSTRHTAAISNFPQPRNVKMIQQFLDLTSYFRKFVENFALKAKPLQNLLRKDTKFLFDDACMNAFVTLKKELISPTILALYNPTAETELHTDVCSQGLGAILMQRQKNGVWLPVAFYSQTTNQAESNYHSFELEMLAVVKAIERFHIYLYGIEFTVVTDCNSLVYAINKANLNPRVARWTLTLQGYRFKMTHRPGHRMAHVDALSRSIHYVNALPLERELEFRQLLDPRIKEIAGELEFNDNPKFLLINGLVYRKCEDNPKFVVPESMVVNVLRAYHDDLAHVGPEKTYKGIASNYWFPSIRIVAYTNTLITALRV